MHMNFLKVQRPSYRGRWSGGWRQCVNHIPLVKCGLPQVAAVASSLLVTTAPRALHITVKRDTEERHTCYSFSCCSSCSSTCAWFLKCSHCSVARSTSSTFSYPILNAGKEAWRPFFCLRMQTRAFSTISMFYPSFVPSMCMSCRAVTTAPSVSSTSTTMTNTRRSSRPLSSPTAAPSSCVEDSSEVGSAVEDRDHRKKRGGSTVHIRSNETPGVVGTRPTQRPRISSPSSLFYVVEPSHVNAAITTTTTHSASSTHRTRLPMPRGTWWRYLRDTLLPWERRLLVMGGGVGMLACVVGHLAIPWSFSVLIDAACRGELPTGTSAQLFGLFGVVFVGQVLRWWCVGTSEAYATARLRKELYDRIMTVQRWGQEVGRDNVGGSGIDGAVMEQRSTALVVENRRFSPSAFSLATLVERLCLDCQQVGQSLTHGVSSLTYHMLWTIGAMTMMWYTSAALAYAVWGLAIPAMMFSGMYGRYFTTSQRSCQAASTAMKAVAEERLAWREAMQWGWYTHQKEREWFNVMVDRHRHTVLSHQRWAGMYRATLSLILYGGCLCLMWAGALLVASQRLTPGGLMAFVVYSGYALWSAMGMVQGVVQEVNRGYVSWLRLWEVVRATEITDTARRTAPLIGQEKEGNGSKEEHNRHGGPVEDVKEANKRVAEATTGKKGVNSSTATTPFPSCSSPSVLLDVSFHRISHPRSSCSSPLLLREVSCTLFPPCSRPTQGEDTPAVTCVVAEHGLILSAFAAVLLQRCPPTFEQLQECVVVLQEEEGLNWEATERYQKGKEEKERPGEGEPPSSSIPPVDARQRKSMGTSEQSASSVNAAAPGSTPRQRYLDGTVLMRSDPCTPSMIREVDWSTPCSSSSPTWLTSYLGPVSTTMVLEGTVGDNILYGALDLPFGGIKYSSTSNRTRFSFSSAASTTSRRREVLGGGRKGVSAFSPPQHTHPGLIEMIWRMRHEEKEGIGEGGSRTGERVPLHKDPWRHAQLVEAAMKGGAHSFITRELLHGYDTFLLGRRRPSWCSLSHPLFMSAVPSSPRRDLAVLTDGQTQLIGLARALLRHPALLVLDQPTANLDHMGSAIMVRSAIRHLCMPLEGESNAGHPAMLPSLSSSFTAHPSRKDGSYPKGILVCSHDRALVELAQHIIVLGNEDSEGSATVVAQGTFEEVKNHPVFCRAVR